LAAAYEQPGKKMSTEAKLGITAIVLALVILTGAAGWWLLTIRSDSEQARQIAEKLSQELNSRDKMRAAQEEMINKLEDRIQQLTANNTPENQARVSELREQLQAAQAEIDEIETKPFEVAQAIQEIKEEARHKPESSEKSEPKPQKKETESKNKAQSNPPKQDDLNAIPSDPYSEKTSTGSYEAKPASTEPAPSAEKSTDDVEDLIESAISRPQRPGSNTLPAPDTGGVPTVPSRDQVKTAMNSVTPSIKKCSDGNGGRIELQISVSGATGRIIDAQPIGSYAGTTVGICAARAVRVAKFPKFSQSNLVIKYPFDL
jgi:uncharacterized protein YoxC